MKYIRLDTLVMIQTKFGSDWSSSFRGEDLWKRLRCSTDDDDDGRQVMAIQQHHLQFSCTFSITVEISVSSTMQILKK